LSDRVLRIAKWAVHNFLLPTKASHMLPQLPLQHVAAAAMSAFKFKCFVKPVCMYHRLFRLPCDRQYTPLLFYFQLEQTGSDGTLVLRLALESILRVCVRRPQSRRRRRPICRRQHRRRRQRIRKRAQYKQVHIAGQAYAGAHRLLPRERRFNFEARVEICNQAAAATAAGMPPPRA
jgi:hypothetical protein